MKLKNTRQRKQDRKAGTMYRACAIAVCLWLTIVAARPSRAQIVGIPFAATATGAGSMITVGAYCSGNSGPTALDTFGDGCPASEGVIKEGTPKDLWTDSYGNIYIADYTNSYLVRVIYHGGAPMATLITSNNPTLSGSPQVGYIYAIAGSPSKTKAASASNPYCNGSSGTKMVDLEYDGCPAYEAWVQPTGGATDADGDVFLADHTPIAMVRVIYAGGAAAAALINLEVGVTSPVIGSIYRIGGPSTGLSGFSGNGGLASNATFGTLNSLIVDSNENIYIADTTNNVVRMISGSTGVLTALAGGSGAGCVSGTAGSCTATFAGDGGPAVSASLDSPYDVALDANDNVYIADAANKRIRIVYNAGTLPALTAATAAGISNLVAGDIYTIAGGINAGAAGTSRTNGTAAKSLGFNLPRGVSLDALGNIYVTDVAPTGDIWRIDGQTGIGTIFAGGGSATTAGSFCSGSAGPVATDTVGDGCPATRAYLDQPAGRLVFDANNVGYVIDDINGLIRSFTFNERFPDTAVGSSSSFPIAVTSPSSFVTPVLAATAEGSTTSEFSSSNVNCTSGTIAANTVCTYNIQFTPALPGLRVGKIQVTSTSSTGALTYGLDGKGLGPLLAAAPSVSSIFASSITTPANVAADQIGNIYVSDASKNTLWKGAVGGTFTAALTGLSSPGQAAIDGAGNVYVADTGNNRIVELSASGVVSTLAVSGLSSPNGIASTGNGVLYIADTGNNRILRYDETQVVTLAITGLSGPTVLALDGSGLLYIADTGNSRIVAIASDGTQSVVSVGTTIKPVGLAVDAGDDIYIADKSSDSVLVLFSGASAAAKVAGGLTSPAGIALDGSGDLYYTDAAVAGVNEIAQQQAALTFTNTNEGSTSAAQALTLSNIGNQSFSFTSVNTYAGSGDTTDFAISQGTPACGSGPIAAAGSCALSVQFTPLSIGAYQETLTFPTTVNVGSATAQLTGTGVNLIKTSIAAVLTSPASGGVSYGQDAVYTATITPSSTTTALSGTVVVSVDGKTSQTLTVSGASTQFTLALTAGTHAISVTYSGNSVYASSFDTFSLTVSPQATTTSLFYSSSLQSGTPSLTLTAQVAATISGVPTETVTFYNGSTVVGTATLNAQGMASYTTNTTTYPSYSFRAVYSGDTSYASSSSATVTLNPDFSVIAGSNVISAANGIPTNTTVTLIPYFGYTGTLTYSCTGLPVDSACRFQPQSVALSSGTSQMFTLEFFTDLPSSSVALLHQHGRRELTSLACLFAPMLLLGGWRRRGVHGKVWFTVLLVGCLIGAGSLAGCSKSTSYPTGSTPTGASTVVLTVTDATGLSHAVTYNVTVY
jgi:hypothetical protein